MREGSVKAPLRAKYISHQLEEGHWVSAYAPADLVRMRGRRTYHNWGDRAPWPTSYSLQAIEMCGIDCIQPILTRTGTKCGTIHSRATEKARILCAAPSIASSQLEAGTNHTEFSISVGSAVSEEKAS